MVQTLARVSGLFAVVGGVIIAVLQPTQMASLAVFHLPSLAFVVLVTSGVGLMAFQFGDLLNGLRHLWSASPTKLVKAQNSIRRNAATIIDRLHAGQSIDKLEPTSAELEGWMEDLQKAVHNKIPSQRLAQSYSEARRRVESQLFAEQHVFQTLCQLAPSIGILGTVLGLIRLLAHMDDMQAMGQHMSLALATTFYGVILGSCIFLPLAHRMYAIRLQTARIYEELDALIDLWHQRQPSHYLRREGQYEILS